MIENWKYVNLNKGSHLAKQIQGKSIQAFETILFEDFLAGSIGYGGYLEERDLYQRSDVFKAGDQFRSIHLGIDIWAPVNTPIFSPEDSVVHSLAMNDNAQDFGGTIILKTKYSNLYLLFGHLSTASLNRVSIGDAIKKGELVGYLGNRKENGNWPPHLHFQLIKNIENKKGDYFAVCTKSELAYYKENCPNPELYYSLPILLHP